MWPFNKPSESGARLAEEVTALRHELRELIYRFNDLESKHTQLRGRVYKAGIHKHPLKDDEQAQEETLTRDELRRRAGFVPGKPYAHKS